MIFEKIKQKIISFGLTSKELNFILILIAILLIGIIVKSIRLSNPDFARFDYSALDSIFAERKNKFDSSDDKYLGASDSVIVKELNHRSGLGSKQIKLMHKKINLNTATLHDLMTLPGVGEKTAKSILEFRSANKNFRTIEQLLEIKGIGEKKFDKIKEFVRINEN